MSATTRNIKSDGVAWCWQDKAALRKLRECFDESGDVCHALAVYLALTELASDGQADVFTAKIATIAERAGLSYRKTAPILDSLESIGVLAVVRNTLPGSHLKAPSTYRIISIGTACASIGTDRNRPSVPRYTEESSEESSEEEGVTDFPVEFPRNFPKTETDAAAHAAFVGCTEDFAKRVWNEAAARGGTDCFSNPIRLWRQYLAGRHSSETSKTAERKQHGGKTNTPPDHSKGF